MGNPEVDGGYFVLPYRRSSFGDARQFKKFVESAVLQVRRCSDYSRYLAYLKGDAGLDRCAFLGSVSEADASLEFHHYPLPLKEVVSVVTLHMASLGEVSTLQVASEVASAHLRHLVGGVMLSATAHEMFHAGRLFIHLSQVFGDYRGFLDEYAAGVDRGVLESLESLSEASARLLPQGGSLRVEPAFWQMNGVQALRPSDFGDALPDDGDV